MKVQDCKAIRRGIEEADQGQEPDAVTMSHLRQCRVCREFLESEKKLRQVMASLAPVEAPADFDFRLRARIATERIHSRRGFSIGNFSLGIPTLTFAALILLAAGVFLLPRLNSLDETSPNVALQPVTDNNAGTVVVNAPSPSGPTENVAGTDGKKDIRPAPPSRRPKAAGRKETLASQRAGQLVVRDSGVVGATVLKQEDSAVDSQIPLIFPLQTMKVSVDDGSGVSRTISFPTVSFGSQRFLTNAGSSLNPSAKGVW
jgi:hypothetical protein